MECAAIESKLGSIMKNTTHSSTQSTVDGDDEAHDGIAKYASADSIFPVQADGDDGRSCAKEELVTLSSSTRQAVSQS